MGQLHDNLERERLFKDLVAHDVKLKAPESNLPSSSILPTTLEVESPRADSAPLSYGNLTDNDYTTIQLSSPSRQPQVPRLDDPIIADTDDTDSQERIAQLRRAFSGITSEKSFSGHNGTSIDLADCLRHDILRPDHDHPETIKFIDSVSLLVAPQTESRLQVRPDLIASHLSDHGFFPVDEPSAGLDIETFGENILS